MSAGFLLRACVKLNPRVELSANLARVTVETSGLVTAPEALWKGRPHILVQLSNHAHVYLASAGILGRPLLSGTISLCLLTT